MEWIEKFLNSWFVKIGTIVFWVWFCMAILRVI